MEKQNRRWLRVFVNSTDFTYSTGEYISKILSCCHVPIVAGRLLPCLWVPSLIRGRHIRGGYHSLWSSRDTLVTASSLPLSSLCGADTVLHGAVHQRYSMQYNLFFFTSCASIRYHAGCQPLDETNVCTVICQLYYIYIKHTTFVAAAVANLRNTVTMYCQKS